MHVRIFHTHPRSLLLKLSGLLRYSVYETKKAFVSLQEELEYIKNYISFEKLRLSDRLVLQSDLNIADGNNIQIAPMVLIVFIENAFKHAQNTLDEKIYISIKLTASADQVLFTVENSHNETKKYNTLHHSSGLGLANTIKRLNLLYETDCGSLLPAGLFIRVHRSFIINKSKISHIEGNTVYIEEMAIPIGVNYKEQFFKAIGM